MADEPPNNQQRIQAATSADIPHLNANTVVLAMGSSDVLLVLEQNFQAVATLNISFTMAKSLAVILGNIIADLEGVSSRPIMTSMEVEKMIAAIAESKVEVKTASKVKASTKPKSQRH